MKKKPLATGKDISNAVIALARQIADLCLASPLASAHSMQDAISIANILLSVNASETAVR